MRKGSKKETPPDPAPETPRGGVPEDVPSPADEDCLEERLAVLLAAGIPAVLLTIVSSRGSAPRHAGTRALLTAAGLEGTVGEARWRPAPWKRPAKAWKAAFPPASPAISPV